MAERSGTCQWGSGGDSRSQRYVASAIESEQRRIASAPTGQRNHTLFTASIAIGQLAGADAITLGEAEELLSGAAQGHVEAGAYSAGQARQTIASGLRRGIAEPRQLPADLATERKRR